ncbi:MAG: acyltransferase [Rhodobacteraceae bacterium]|nr:acyltransferase [Paracoccaceae bacterium]
MRVLCVTAMMWVHVNPGLSEASAVTTGDYPLIGAVFGETLGRISVSLLSFLSGYLFWITASKRPFEDIAQRRFLSVMVPMLVWSTLYVLLASAQTAAGEGATSSVRGIGATILDFVNAVTGIAGPTANQSLFFLRDLFVVTMIAALLRPLIRHFPTSVGVGIVIAGSFDVYAPLVFRPSILQFFLIGAVLARLGVSITRLSQPMIALPIGYLLTVLGIVLSLRPELFGPMTAEVPSFVRRSGIAFLMMAIAASLVGLAPGLRIDRLGRHAFLAYLMHVPLISLLWLVWRHFIGGADLPAYTIFFLFAPAVSFALSVFFGSELDHAPERLQTLLRGKSFDGDEPKGPR